MTNAA